MLQQGLHILFITVSCLLCGLPAAVFLQRRQLAAAWWKGNGIETLCFLFFAGLVTLSVVCSWLVLWIPLNTITALVVLACFAAWALIRYRHVQEFFHTVASGGRKGWMPVAAIAMTLIILMVLVLGTLHPVNEDSKTYYVQLVRWSREYGTVPGLANLFPRFGLGSNWLNLTAFFELPFAHRNYTWLNGTAACWFLLLLLSRALSLLAGSGARSNSRAIGYLYLLVLMFSLVEWEIVRDGAASPNVDFMVSALSILVLAGLLKNLAEGTNLREQLNPVLVIACLAVASFKLSGVFLSLVPLYLLVRYGSLRQWVSAGSLALLILSPVLIRNYFTSGYPLFPLLWEAGHPDWQLPAPMARFLHDYILVTNRYYNTPVQFSQVPELATGNWMGYWISGLPWRQKLSLLATLLPLAGLLLPQTKAWRKQNIIMLFVLCYLLLLAWFLTAPAPRFGFGVISILVCWLPAVLLATYGGRLMPSVGLVVLCTATLVYTYFRSEPIRREPSLVWHTESFLQPHGQAIGKGALQMLVPEVQPGRWMHDCFDAPLPCLPADNPYLEPRGATLQQGFRMQLPDSGFVRHYVY